MFEANTPTRTHRPSASRVAAMVAMAAVATTWSFVDLVAASPVGPPVDSGDVLVVDPTRRDVEVTGGDGYTEFTLRLPDGSTCPGDSASDQWRVQSFFIPVSDDPGSLSYGVIGPEGAHQYALFGADAAAQSYDAVLLPLNSEAGQPGRIESPPAFSYAAIAGELVPTGTYRIGLACTYFADTAKFWDTQIIIMTTSSDGAPGQLTWRLADPPAVTETKNDSSTSKPLVGGVLVVLVLVLGGGSLVLRRRTRTTPRLPKESS